MIDLNCEIRSRVNPMYKKIDKLELVVFDMDGVLTDIQSSWKYIHDFFNTSNEESVELYMRGCIDDEEFIRRDVSLWKIDGRPIKKEKLEEILSNVPIMKGAKETVEFLKNSNIKTAIVSAGLDILAKRIAKELRIDFVYANGLEASSNGYLNGEGIVNVRLKAKDEAVKRLARENGIKLSRTVAVGNSYFDVPMFKVCALGIAFNPEDIYVRKHADFVAENKDLREILPFIKLYIDL